MSTPAASATASPRRYEIWGNWKMNPPTLEDARILFKDIACSYVDLIETAVAQESEKAPFVPFNCIEGYPVPDMTIEEAKAFIDKFKKMGGVGVGLFVPHAYITELGRHPVVKMFDPRTGRLQLGVQNMYYKDKGAFTGELSPTMIVSLFNYIQQQSTVLIGHSERRQLFGETDATVNLKMKAAYQHGLRPFMAIGETEGQRDNGETEGVLEKQLRLGLFEIPADQFLGANTVIAYEPVWAIGTGKTATPEMANDAHAHVRAVLEDMYGHTVADLTTIQYGGSMKPDNAAALLAMPHIDGGLIGGASLSAANFMGIVSAVPKTA